MNHARKNMIQVIYIVIVIFFRYEICNKNSLN